MPRCMRVHSDALHEVPMLKSLFPNAHDRYSSLPLLGPVLDDFVTWMLGQGYRRSSLRVQFGTVVRIDRSLRRRGVLRLSDLSHAILRACWTALHRGNHILGGTLHALQRFLEIRGLLPPYAPTSPSRTSGRLDAYLTHMKDVRGFSSSTVRNHLATAAEFLDHLGYEAKPSRLRAIAPSDLEAFVRSAGERLSRGSLQHVVAHLRGFLRFLAVLGDIRAGLETQIDTPRLYRFEQLPRALPWETVRAFLVSIDRSTPIGLRDYTMFFLIATYGLRVSEIAALTLDDVHWRERRMSVSQRKTGSPLLLPLTDAVATVLLRYLRRGRPASSGREFFLRSRAPAGALKPTAVSMAFEKWSKRSELEIPFFGAHCLRHSFAVHLLRRGTSLKAIGDLLGHRTTEATCAYLRLDTEDLRDVALSVPEERGQRGRKGRRS